MTPSWTLRAWPTVLWQAGSKTHLNFVHLDTRVLNPGDTCSPSTGQTIWVGPLGDVDAGVAWDWVQLGPGVVAMADPMCVVTNLRLVDTGGSVLTAWEAARHLSEIVHGLPWQDEVERALGSTLLN
ncbi:hypothetical protein V4F39_22975 [Aquincola sp. MAHUQ-54]|uniref:DUF4902 domain-containing protein n=1 Tax=Aquincola agrisoli TaxID=3119538 RepID=A0AAW9QAG3_9BURK